jgi:hypothetical protein
MTQSRSPRKVAAAHSAPRFPPTVAAITATTAEVNRRRGRESGISKATEKNLKFDF